MGLLKDSDLPTEEQQKKAAETKSQKVHIMPPRPSVHPAAAPVTQVAAPPAKRSSLFVRKKKKTKTVGFLDLLLKKKTDSTVEDGSTSTVGNGLIVPGDLNPGKRLSSIEKASHNSPRLKIPLKYRMKPDKGLLRRAAWDVSTIASLFVNAILLSLVILLLLQVRNLKNTVNNLVSGLYDNFVALDDSVIATTLNVSSMTIPLDFTLPVMQPSTNVTLTENVTIRNAYVVINTDSVKINSAATVTLPRGTVLPVSLNMEVPVQTTVLVDLSVPVVIKLSESNPPGDQVVGLHDAFLGLQNTIGPYFCLMNPDVVANGRYICSQGDYLPEPVNP